MIESIYKEYCKSWRVTTDSRNVAAGSIFFALKGNNFDGNAFAKTAIENGASLAVIDNPKYQQEGCVLVRDTLEAIQQLANLHRKNLNTRIIAITGSNGKTTTKELIHAVLSKKYKTHATIGNLNNHIGVPLTLLSLTPDVEMAIVEMGANHPGDIDLLCRIAEPDYGLITNIGKAHLGGFGSFDGVISTKGELFRYLIAANKQIFYNDQNLVIRNMLDRYNAMNVIPYTSYAPSYIINQNNQTPFLRITLIENNNNLELQTNLVGSYNAENILAAYTVGRYFGVSKELVKEAIESYTPSNNRSQLVNTSRNTVIMDAYNANPSSMEQALKNFAQLNFSKKVAILGEMLELGDYSEGEHRKIVHLALSINLSQLILVGKGYETSKHDALYFDNVDLCLEYLRSELLSDATILLKGSRGVKLERLMEVL